MSPLSASFLLILAGCSGGSGGARWTPTAAPAAAYPWLIDDWSGRYTTVGDTAPDNCYVVIREGAGQTLTVQVAGFGFPSGGVSGQIETDGSKFRIAAGDFVAEGNLYSETLIEVTNWSRPGMSGTARLERALSGFGATVLVDDPGLLVVLRYRRNDRQSHSQ